MRAAKLITTTVALFGAAILTPAHATTLDFEVPTSGFSTAFGSYRGFSFGNFYALDSAEFSNVYGSSGYGSGTTSGTKVAYNGFGTDSVIYSATPFTFNSASFASAWRDGLQIRVQGFITDGEASEGTLPDYAATFSGDSSFAITQTFNWTGLKYLYFSTSGGIKNPAVQLDGTQFVLDDVRVNEAFATSTPTGTGTPFPTDTTSASVSSLARQDAVLLAPSAVPEPAGWAMLIGGIGVVGMALRRRARRLVALAA